RSRWRPQTAIHLSMRLGAALLLAGWCLACAAQVPPGYPAGYGDVVAAAEREGRLAIYAATDVPAAAPLLRAFAAIHPGIKVDYQEMTSVEVFKRFLAESRSGRSADILWSPAMDLQMKLVNDGHAQAYRSPEAARLPTWAVWRDEAYGTTFEP